MEVKAQKSVYIVDPDPIHHFAFQEILKKTKSGGVDVRAYDYNSWGALSDMPDLILFNMAQRKFCAQGFMRKVMNAIPDVPVVCYSFGRKVSAHVFRQFGNRIITLSYEEIIAFLECYITNDDENLNRQPSLFADRDQEQETIDLLSPRESEIFYWFGRGNGPVEIAEKLGCSPSTIETHVKNIRNKLNLKNSVELRCLAVESLLAGSCFTMCHC